MPPPALPAPTEPAAAIPRTPPGRRRRGAARPLFARLALLAAAATAALAAPAAAQPASCADMTAPAASTDESPAVLDAGPALLAPAGGFVIDPATDALELLVQSAPGIGNQAKTAFTRTLGLALSGTDVDKWDDALALPEGCRRLWDRFSLGSVPENVSVTTGESPTSAAASGAAQTCFFTHRLSLPWEDFRSEALNSCGFSKIANATANEYRGRLHVRWADYATLAASTPVHSPSSMWYAVSVRIAAEATVEAAPVSNQEAPVKSAFAVTSVSYLTEPGHMHFKVAYEVSTAWPYYPYFPSEDTGVFDDGTQLTSRGGGINAFPSRTWLNSYDDGMNGTASCSKPSDECTMRGTLVFAWDPSAETSSCTVAGTYSFNPYLGCSPASNATNYCGLPLRSALGLPDSYTAFDVPETIVDPCTVSTTAGTPDGGSAPPLGSDVGFSLSTGFRQPVAALQLRSYRLSRKDLLPADGYWDLWDPTGEGAATAMGTAVSLEVSIAQTDQEGRQWALTSAFRPNMHATATPVAASYSAPYVVSLPDDLGKAVELEVAAELRMFLAGPARRRLGYRDGRLLKRQGGDGDLGMGSGPLDIEVPSSIPYNATFMLSAVTYSKAADGTVTAGFSYSAVMNWPYRAYLPAPDADKLAHAAGYAGLQLASFPSSAWSHEVVRNGSYTENGDECTAYGQRCALVGTLSFSWKPTPGSSPASCGLSSPDPQRFVLSMACMQAGFNDAADCDEPLATVLSLPDFGAWRLLGDVDFCKSAASDFAAAWSVPYDADRATRALGQPVTARGSFSLGKRLEAVRVGYFRVQRTDLSGGDGYWSLWDAGAVSSAGSATALGTAVSFGKSIVPSGDGKSWSVETSFTPNVRLTSAPASLSYADRAGQMIVLPWDTDKTLAFVASIQLRMFADATAAGGARRRRLAYRDEAAVQPLEAGEATATASAVFIRVATGANAASAGQATASSSGISTGAAAGIAAIAALAVAGAAVAGVLVYRRRRKARVVRTVEVQVNVAGEKGDGKKAWM